MLIIPAEHKIDWQRPPVITLILIALNIALFIRFDSSDQQLYQEAYDYYVANDMYRLEAPEYSDYLLRQVNLGLDDRYELAEEVQSAVAADNPEYLIPVMMFDRGFVEYLQLKGAEFIDPAPFALWLSQREVLHTRYLDHISSWQYGLIPGDIQLGNLVSYQFLHGSLMHLAGNMVFLFLLGFAIERILGKALYVLTYLTAGAIGGLFYALIEGSSMQPLIGASASISGLMGMYVAYYRLKKIRFFYFIVFYFNYFRAPALLLLPFWLAVEFYYYFYGNTPQVAYMAHAGGLLAGAALMIPWRRWYQETAADDRTEEEKDTEFRSEISKGLSAVSKVDFDRARSIFLKLHEQHPHHHGIVRQLFHLYKIHPDDPESQRFTQLALETALYDNDIEGAVNILADFEKYSGDTPLSEPDYYFRLLNGCLSSNRLGDAEKLLESMAKHIQDRQLLAEAFKAAIQVFNIREMPMKAKKLEKRLEQLFA